ncbi:hypothetical protein M1771_03560 [Spiroplasma citri]|uniref:Uncharacterized protein n=1 Tax=Spiroplasma citri TaxID=2133 RepID=A0AAQ3DLV5_SPICI|nr:hypothetical protein [Spiroplasma citri]WFG95694.1 hypothetical protein M0C40_06225 [Spiroplasma citri]WFG96122.1 hypothetical protein M0C40_08540 [Spiroplasma citri]WFG96606.1 hypothetical protein M0C40_00900 [Spiroplasma citri]WFG97093.1 hypothetical protein M0C40_03560 [Spiroplasma citri]WFG99579.1 hypothetical protein M1771_06175 [Spiroplasma citri]
MKCQRISCNNKNVYCGNSYIEKNDNKLEWNLNYKKQILLCKEHWLQTYQLENLIVNKKN